MINWLKSIGIIGGSIGLAWLFIAIFANYPKETILFLVITPTLVILSIMTYELKLHLDKGDLK